METSGTTAPPSAWRGWDTIVLVALPLLWAIAAAGRSTPLAMGGTALVLLALGLVYALHGRRVLAGSADPRLFLAFLAIAAALGPVVSPGTATTQALVMPMAWFAAATTRQAILTNIAIAAGVTLGYLIGVGFTLEGLALILVIEAVSLGGSLLLGLYIVRTVESAEERQRLLSALLAARAESEELSRASGVAEERQRLSRELHDTIAQSLTGLVLLAQRGRRSPDTAAEVLALIEENAQDALAEARALIAATAPARLASAGLTASLQRLAERFARETGIEVSPQVAEIPGLDRPREVVLLRGAQEGLANVRNHASARHVRLELRQDEEGVLLRITDDGRGPGPRAAGDRGHGLPGLRDRLAEVGGRLSLDPGAGAGTVLSLRLERAETG